MDNVLQKMEQYDGLLESIPLCKKDYIKWLRDLKELGSEIKFDLACLGLLSMYRKITEFNNKYSSKYIRHWLKQNKVTFEDDD